MPKIAGRVRLTKREVDRTSSKGGDTFVWDAEVPGLGLRVRTNGRKLFVFQYATRGRTRRMSLGEVGELTAEGARDRARALRQQVKDGGDPAADRDDARRAETVAQFCDRFLKQHVEVKNKPATDRCYRSLIDGVIRPELGTRKLTDVTRADVQRLHHKLKDTPYAANRLLAVLSKMMNLAERWGVRSDNSNPCRHVERFREKRRQRFLSAVELAELGKVLVEVGRERVEWHSVVPAIRLLIFTGARVSEILTLKGEWVDLERGCLNLPDSKTGAKVIHLNAPALKVLSDIKPDPKDPDNPHVIRGRLKGSCLVNLKDPWGRIRKRAKIPDVRVHDLRHSFAAVAAGAGSSLPIIGALLGHTQPQTTARYAHLAADPLKAAAEAVGVRLAAAMAPKRKKADNVVTFERKRAQTKRG
jgi:integrase